MLRLLFLGDVIGEPGRKAVIEMVPKLKQAWGVDFVVVNGNTPYGNGWSLTDENHLYFDSSENAYLVHGNGGYATAVRHLEDARRHG